METQTIISADRRARPRPKFEIYRDAGGKFRFRLRAANNQIIATSEAYETKTGCNNGIQSVMKNAPKATVRDLTS
ncbi:MAG: YegP family protein [Candidatus Bathyarchaeia archaeon]